MKSQSGFLKLIIRSGFLAEGAVYLAVGLLALQVAVGFGGETGDTKGALEEIGRRRFGGTLLVILAVGLLHYSAWKFVEAFKDPENVGKGPRLLYGASGFLHIYLAYMAAGTVLSGLGVMGGGKSGDQSAQSGTSWLMSQGFGRWLVGAVGVVGLWDQHQSAPGGLPGEVPRETRAARHACLGEDCDDHSRPDGLLRAGFADRTSRPISRASGRKFRFR